MKVKIKYKDGNEEIIEEVINLNAYGDYIDLYNVADFFGDGYTKKFITQIPKKIVKIIEIIEF